jgi:hypothetical protein
MMDVRGEGDRCVRPIVRCEEAVVRLKVAFEDWQ